MRQLIVLPLFAVAAASYLERENSAEANISLPPGFLGHNLHLDNARSTHTLDEPGDYTVEPTSLLAP